MAWKPIDKCTKRSLKPAAGRDIGDNTNGSSGVVSGNSVLARAIGNSVVNAFSVK